MSTSLHPALTGIPATRKQMLLLLKKRGEVSVEDIAESADITLSGARQHLSGLERDGLVSHRERRDGRGRPKHLYALTENGDRLFPRNYADLANELLDYVRDEDPGLVDRLFDRRARRRLEAAKARTAGRPFADRVRIVAQILDEDGYLADFQQQGDGTFLITEHNCAVLSVAQRYAHACGSELSFLRDAMPEAEVTRIAHRLNGGHVCSYLIKPGAHAADSKRANEGESGAE